MNMTTYFIITGVSDPTALRLPVFLIILTMFLLILGGNVTILLLICMDRHLHTPMYFFLANLSILDLCCPCVALHNVLIFSMSVHTTVSLHVCIVQSYVFLSLTVDELLILTVMSYDRYVAICKPLHYNLIMNLRVCGLLATVCWTFVLLEGLPILVELLKLTCFRSNIINHFFCDIVPVMKLSCNDTRFLQIYILIAGGFMTGFLPITLTFISYVFIISSILKIRSRSGQRKAFYTCSSHLTVVILFYSTLVFQYLRPNSMISLGSNKFFSLFNTAAVPVLNPLIYSLKNKDVKMAFRRRVRSLVLV